MFDEYKEIALAKGFRHVASGPLVRSSYHAADFRPELDVLDAIDADLQAAGNPQAVNKRVRPAGCLPPRPSGVSLVLSLTPVLTPMRHWLIKSEPEIFSIHDLARVRREPWTGVRNYQARNFMWNDMKPGDLALFYHSNAKPPGIAGLARVAGAPYPDPTQFDPASEYHDPKAPPPTRAGGWWISNTSPRLTPS